ncbi:MAG: hypothetical protein ACTSQJ_11695 [Promethearchaeota archaeon]
MQTIKLKSKRSLKIKEICSVYEIRDILNSMLYVPDERLKPKVIEELTKFLSLKFEDIRYKLKIFVAKVDNTTAGFVISMIHPTYTSYGRKCGTFGWLHAYDFETCRALIKECEKFVKENKIRKIRGNINFPKGLGGIGIQTMGFEQQMMYGVAFSDPNSKILDYLLQLGYLKESEYTCMKVTKKTWSSGKRVDKSIRLGYVSLDKLKTMWDEIYEIAANSFYAILPDSSGGKHRFKEMIDTYAQVPNSHYKLPEDFDYRDFSDVPEFLEAWENCNLEKVVTWCPMAFDRKTDELVGLILSLPDLYELWLGQPLTRNNVDTVMVRKEYSGKGIFSNLNNIGQITCGFNGITYFEGTSIWSNNRDAINTIFPHCKHIRRHYVVQKRI